MSPRRAARDLLAGAALALQPAATCSGPCEGAGCGAAYGAALVTELRGGALAPELAPVEDAVLVVEGDDDAGPEADVAVAASALWVGLPGAGAVLRYAGDAGGTLDWEADAEASVGVDLDAFGAAIDVAEEGDGAWLAAGAPDAEAGAGGRDEGVALLFTDLDPVAPGEASPSPVDRLSGPSTGSALGESVAICGDLDGDGVREWAAAAPLAGDGLEGAVAVAAAGGGSRAAEDALGWWWGSSVGAAAGRAIACRHDVDGDGRADLVVGAPYEDGEAEAEGAVYVLAAAEGVGALAEHAVAVLYGGVEESWLGRAIATADLDGDGFAEVLAGAPGAGRAAAWSGADLAGGGSPEPLASLSGEAEGDRFGRAVLAADLDGDGALDLVVGAPARDPTDDGSAFGAGAAYAWLGAGALEGELAAAEADVRIAEARPFLDTGRALAAGDLDGDGIADLVLAGRHAAGR